jgi:hypothetical protein
LAVSATFTGCSRHVGLFRGPFELFDFTSSPSQLGGSSVSEGRAFFARAKSNLYKFGLPLSSMTLDFPQGE